MSAEVYSIHVKVDSTQATTAAKDLGKLETAAGKAENSLKQLSTTSGNTASAAKTLSGAMDSTEASMRKATGAIESVGKAANAVRGAFVVLIGVEVARFMREMASTVREAADAYTQLTSRLAVGTVSQIEAGKAMREVTQIANKYYLSIVDVGNAYSKLNPILADMGRNQADTRSVVESVSAALAIQNGATVDSAETMRQLSQALSGNVLQMEEMNTIIDSAQPLWRGLNKVFAESVAKFGSLKNAISSQAITSEMLTDALIRLKPEFEELAARNTPTLAKAMTVLNNNFITYIGEADKAQGASKELGKMILDLADNLDKVLDPWMEFGKATGEAGIAFGKLATELAPALEIIAKGLAGFFTTVSTSLEGLKLLADGLGAITGNVEKLKGLLGVNEAVVSDRTLERINKELQLNKEKLSQYSEMDRYKLLDAQKIKDLEKEIAILTRMKELVFQNADAKRKAEEEEIKRIDAQRQANKRPEVVDEKAAKKAREQAEKNFEAMIKFQVAEAENVAKLEKEKLETKLKLLEREKKAIETTADLEASSVKTKTERLAIYSDEMTKLEEKYVKEYEIKQSMLQLEVDLAEKRIEAVDTLISKQQEFGNTEADLLGLQKERADLVNELSIIQEEANRLDLEAKYEIAKSAENYNKELAKTEDQTKNVREEALRTLETLSSNLEYSRELARGLADAFGEVGAAIGGMSVAMAEYDKQSATVEIARQEAITKAAGDQKKIDEANTTAAKKQSQAEIKKYGDMTQAAQGFFKKGTAGYKAMETATKAFRALEVAQQAMSFAEQLGGMDKLFGSFETMLKQMGILSDMNKAKEIANSQAAGTQKALEGAAQQGTEGDPYTAFARVAAWIALMAGLGFMVGGGAGGSAPPPPPALAGTGTVKGDPTKQSESIARSLEILTENSTNDLNYSADMLEALQNIESALASASDLIASKVLPLIGNVVSRFTSDSMLSSSSVKEAGFLIGSQSLTKVLESGLLKGQLGARIETEQFGLLKSGKTITTEYGKDIASAFGKIVQTIYKSIEEVAKAISIPAETIADRAEKLKISLGKINLAGMSADEAAKAVAAAVSAMSDKMARKLLPEFKDFQRNGEGYFETINRVAEGINRATGNLELLGMEAINYTEITDKQKDVAAEITRQTIMAQGDLTEGTREYVRQLDGSAEDIVDSYKKILDITNLMKGAGFGTEGLDRTLINAAGGLDDFASSLQSFYDNFLSDEQRVAAQTAQLTTEFGKLGYSLPKSKDEFARLAQSIDRSTEDGKKLFAALIRLSQSFSDLIDSSNSLAEANKAAAEAAIQAAEAEASAKAKAAEEAMATATRAAEAAVAAEEKLVAAKAKAAEVIAEIERKQQEELLKAEEKRLQDIQKVQEDLAAQAKKAYDDTFNVLAQAFDDLEKVQERYISVGKTLLQFYRELTGAKMPMASPEERYRLARQELDRVRSLAATGNEEALALLVDAGKDFLDASKEYNASSAAYQQDYQLVLQTLEDGQAYAQAQVNVAQAQLDMAKAQYSQLQKVDASVLTVTGSVSNLTTAMSAFAKATEQNTSAAIAAANAAAVTAAASNAISIATATTAAANSAAAIAAANAAVTAANNAANAANNASASAANAAAVAAAAAATAAAAAAAAKVPVTQPDYSGVRQSWVSAPGVVTYYNPPALVAPGILARAEGGATPPGMTLVGEKGPELVTFGSSSYVSTAGQTQGFFAGIQDTIKAGDAMQVNELQALVRLQSAANQQLIKEMKELKGEMAELSRKAKLEAAA